MGKCNLKKVGRKVADFIKAVAFGVFFIIVASIGLLVWNPLCFWIWAAIAPKSAARSYYGMQSSSETISSMLGELYSFNDRVIKHLPRRAKEVFFEESGFVSPMTYGDLERYVQTNAKTAIKHIRRFPERLQRSMWAWYPTYWPEMIEALGVLTLQQFQSLVSAERWELVKKYIFTRTPSERMLLYLIRSDEKALSDSENILLEYAKSKGLPSSVINAWYKACKGEDLSVALGIFAEKQMLQVGSLTKWRTFVAKRTLAPESEILMNAEQYRIYHETHDLSDEALVFFLSKDDSLSQEILRDCIKAGRPLTEQMRNLINAQRRLLEIVNTPTQAEADYPSF
jgi:hypothetical protein